MTSTLLIAIVALLLTALALRRATPPNTRTLTLLLLLSAPIVTAAAALTFQIRTDLDWNSVRAAAPVALSLGYPLYYPPSQGPLWGIIYPPLGFLLSLPIALASHPTTAIRIGQTLSLAWTLLPLCAIPLLLAKPPDSPPTPIPRSTPHPLLLTFLLATSALVSIPPLTDAALNVHIDAPALGLSLLATLLLLSAAQPSAPPTPGLPARHPFLTPFLAGTLAVASVFTKQTFLATPLTLFILTLLPTHRHLLRPYLTGVLLSSLALSALCLLAFPPANLIYHTLTVPSRHGFPGGFIPALYRNLPSLALHLLPLALVSITLSLYSRHPSPTPPTSHPIPAPPSHVLLLIALAHLPLSLAGFLKVGGGPNNLAPVAFFLLAALLFNSLRPPAPSRPSPLPLLLLTALGLSLWRLLALAQDPALSRPDQHATSFAAIRASPGSYYFPRLPLSHLLAENRLTHHTWGLTDRENAAEPVSTDWLLQYTPPSAQYLAYFSRPPGPTVHLHTRLLPTFPHPTTLPDLPGWLLFARSGAPLPPPPPSPATQPPP